MIKVLNNRASGAFCWFAVATMLSLTVKVDTTTRFVFLATFLGGVTAVHVQQVVEEIAQEAADRANAPKAPAVKQAVTVASVAVKPSSSSFKSTPRTTPRPQTQPQIQRKAIVEDLWAEPELVAAGSGLTMDNWMDED